LAPVFDEYAAELDIEGIFEYSERIEEIERLFNLLRPQLYSINANHCIDVLSLEGEEKYECVVLFMLLFAVLFYHLTFPNSIS